MKTKVTILPSVGVLALSTILISSCDDKADNQSFEATLEETIQITVLDEGTNVAYSEITILDATSNADIDKYKDKMTGFTVEKVTCQVVAFEFGDPTSAFSGNISFGDATSPTPIVTSTVANLNFQDYYRAEGIFDLPFSQNDLGQIANLLKNDKEVKIFLAGTLSATSISVVFRINLEVLVNVDSL